MQARVEAERLEGLLLLLWSASRGKPVKSEKRWPAAWSPMPTTRSATPAACRSSVRVRVGVRAKAKVRVSRLQIVGEGQGWG